MFCSFFKPFFFRYHSKETIFFFIVFSVLASCNCRDTLYAQNTCLCHKIFFAFIITTVKCLKEHFFLCCDSFSLRNVQEIVC